MRFDAVPELVETSAPFTLTPGYRSLAASFLFGLCADCRQALHVLAGRRWAFPLDFARAPSYEVYLVRRDQE